MKFQKFMDKKITLDSNEPLSFWTNEYKMELENYLMQFFGEKIEASLLTNDLENHEAIDKIKTTEEREDLSEDVAIRTAQKVFKV